MKRASEDVLDETRIAVAYLEQRFSISLKSSLSSDLRESSKLSQVSFSFSKNCMSALSNLL